MKCPHCNINLVMSERQGVEIDYCPDCRGVWLDRGELDKIIEKSSAGHRENSHKRDYQPENHYNKQDYKREHEYKDYKHRKKEGKFSFLEDIFDFG